MRQNTSSASSEDLSHGGKGRTEPSKKTPCERTEQFHSPVRQNRLHFLRLPDHCHPPKPSLKLDRYWNNLTQWPFTDVNKRAGDDTEEKLEISLW